MAKRSHTTFKKRQKELARMEKQRDKVARREQRKLEKANPEIGEGMEFGEGLEPEAGDDLPEGTAEPLAPVEAEPAKA